MRTPITLVTGVHHDAMAVSTVALQWDLPRAVVARHRIDVERQLLERVVSDASGIVERAEIDLAHACVSCALREDVLPTLVRLAQAGRWDSVVAHLPVGTIPALVCQAIAADPVAARRLRVARILVGIEGPRVAEDLLEDDLLQERGLHSAVDDRRGVGEVLARMIEYADAAVLVGGASPTGAALVRELARPDAVLLDDVAALDPRTLPAVDEKGRDAWADADRRGELPPLDHPLIWRADLRSDRPFRPDRLLADIALLGAGRHRSRGCFWLPTRPGRMGAWDGAGGQLSIGTLGPWQYGAPHTRIVLVGSGSRPHGLEAAFESLLITPREMRVRGAVWESHEDGLEPWLGPIRRVA